MSGLSSYIQSNNHAQTRVKEAKNLSCYHVEVTRNGFYQRKVQ